MFCIEVSAVVGAAARRAQDGHVPAFALCMWPSSPSFTFPASRLVESAERDRIGCLKQVFAKPSSLPVRCLQMQVASCVRGASTSIGSSFTPPQSLLDDLKDLAAKYETIVAAGGARRSKPRNSRGASAGGIEVCAGLCIMGLRRLWWVVRGTYRFGRREGTEGLQEEQDSDTCVGTRQRQHMNETRNDSRSLFSLYAVETSRIPELWHLQYIWPFLHTCCST